jgi:hypothetical protein
MNTQLIENKPMKTLYIVVYVIGLSLNALKEKENEMSIFCEAQSDLDL